MVTSLIKCSWEVQLNKSFLHAPVQSNLYDTMWAKHHPRPLYTEAAITFQKITPPLSDDLLKYLWLMGSNRDTVYGLEHTKKEIPLTQEHRLSPTCRKTTPLNQVPGNYSQFRRQLPSHLLVKSGNIPSASFPS